MISRSDLLRFVAQAVHSSGARDTTVVLRPALHNQGCGLGLDGFVAGILGMHHGGPLGRDPNGVAISVGFQSVNVQLTRNCRRAVDPAGIVTARSYIDLPVCNGRDGEFDRIARHVCTHH